MARPRTEFRNELRTRVTDRVYEAVQRYLQVHRCGSEARAIADLLEVALFGMEGSEPHLGADSSANLSQFETKMSA